MHLEIQRLDKDVPLPQYMHEDDVALDLPSREELTLQPHEKRTVKTGIKMSIPKGHAGLIWDRSGLAAKNALHCLAGVIDAGYQGEIGVVLVNLSDEQFSITKGMRIAQILIQPITQCSIQEVEEFSDNSSRKENGFGSTGLDEQGR